MSKANKPDFSEQQKIIFQAARRHDQRFATEGVIRAWHGLMAELAGVCRGCAVEIELPWR
jgi:hypothetical protein